MRKQDQEVQQKVLSFKTLTSTHIEEVTKFIVINHNKYETSNEQQRLRLHSLIHTVMVPALQSEWSFGLFDGKSIVGAYLQLDVLDYLKIQQIIGSHVMSQLFNISQFHAYFQKIKHSIKRGQYVLTIFNTANAGKDNSIKRKELALIYQGFYLIKIGGWVNVLFSTSNPIPFLKISADVVMQSVEYQNQDRSYLMKLNMNQFNLTQSPFQKVYAKL